MTNKDNDLLIDAGGELDTLNTQLEYLRESCDINVDELTMLDVFTIYLHWRIENVSPIGNFGEGQEVDMSNWFEYIGAFMSMQTSALVSDGVYELSLDIPKFSDFIKHYELYTHISDDDERSNVVLNGLNNYLWIREIKYKGNVVGVNGSMEKLSMFFSNLPTEIFEKVINHINHINDLFNKLQWVIYTDNGKFPVTLNSLHTITNIIFGGDIHDSHTKYLFLSKKRGASYEWFKNATPMEVDRIINEIISGEKEQPQGEMDELISQ